MDLKLYSWNVNGIRANIKRGSFNNFLSSEDPDIICLQETRLSESINSIPEIKNYHQYWASSERPGYSGTAILTKLKPISTFNGFTEKVQQKYRRSYGREINLEIYKSWHFFETYHQENIKNIQVNLLS